MKKREARAAIGRRRDFATLAFVLGATCMAGCGSQDSTMKNKLESMQTGQIQIKGHTFKVWLAFSPAEQELGLMQVQQDELAAIPPDTAAGIPNGADRGMLFVFDEDLPRSFWMRNTIIPLDIAYIREDGTIVKTHTMAPLETRLYPSVEPARFALEVRAGRLAELGITRGDKVEISDSILKASP
ncbi:MAG: DUF192 domain-containing protein [Phycisphaerae bacterium]|nr:DUF192 domain-containing protein [Phycisphaerae bacterium]